MMVSQFGVPQSGKTYRGRLILSSWIRNNIDGKGRLQRRVVLFDPFDQYKGVLPRRAAKDVVLPTNPISRFTKRKAFLDALTGGSDDIVLENSIIVIDEAMLLQGQFGPLTDLCVGRFHNDNHILINSQRPKKIPTEFLQCSNIVHNFRIIRRDDRKFLMEHYNGSEILVDRDGTIVQDSAVDLNTLGTGWFVQSTLSLDPR